MEKPCIAIRLFCFVDLNMKTILCLIISFSYASDENLKYIFEYFKNGLPSDDPQSYNVDTTINYQATLDSSLYWVVPDAKISSDINILKSNNNVAIEFFDNRIFIAFRTSSSHFAGSSTKMVVLSSENGEEWDKEIVIEIDKDIREPLFAKIDDRLMFYYFKAGVSSIKFQPTFTYMIERIGLGEWQKEKQVSKLNSRVFWSMKNRNNRIYVTSYEGEHYQFFGKSNLKARLLQSVDGISFDEISSTPQYIGGVSEIAFEFNSNGDLWGVSRNEDGDKSGFGSHLFFAGRDSIDQWQIVSTTKNIFMSPRMLRHGDDIYLIARRNKGSLPFGFMPKIFPRFMQRAFNWLKFSASAKTTALYKINKKQKQVEHIVDLPGSGDTAFPAIRRLDKNSFLIANYTSDINKKNRWWFSGQIKPTYIYISRISFQPVID